ncbi:MAG: hypothetical protein GY760_09705, partial [Deltaproteobacteria bacterium]|nr:hypothetical protein [Deltaproteobacteria bacterium]
NSVSRSDKPVLITDKGKKLVKIIPVPSCEKKSWMGCMKGTGKINGDIISPAEAPEAWEVMSCNSNKKQTD